MAILVYLVLMVITVRYVPGLLIGYGYDQNEILVKLFHFPPMLAVN